MMWGAKTMKNKYLALAFVLALVLMFLAGCASPQAAPKDVDEPTKKVVSEPKEVSEPEPEEEPEEVEAEPEPAKVMNKKVAELLGKHEGRVTSLRYMYQDITMKPEEWETWVSGDTMHVKLREMDEIRGDVFVDNIYLNLRTKDAVGYCERNAYRCADPNSPVDVNFNKYYRKTPIEWINEVTYAEKEAEEQMQQRNVWKLKYTEGSKTVYMWVDEYYGVPVKIKVIENGVANDYIFEDIGFNTVDDSDLEHSLVTMSYN
jgi:hypothetical protein